jgi:hypothetical protein
LATAVLIFFNEGRENIELVAVFGPDCGAPELLDLPKRGGVIVVVSNGMNFHGVFLKVRDGQGVDPIVLGMRSDELDERDASAEIESNNHPKIAACDFEPCTFAVQNFCVWSGKAHVVHRTPSGSPNQCSPTMKRHLRLRMPFRVGRKHAPRDNSHVEHYVPELGTLQ